MERGSHFQHQELASHPKPISVDRAIEEHPGKWILMRVTAAEPRRGPIEGYVVSAAKSETYISRKLLRLLRAGDPGAHYCVFSGYARAHSGEDLAESLEAIQTGDLSAWRWR